MPFCWYLIEDGWSQLAICESHYGSKVLFGCLWHFLNRVERLTSWKESTITSITKYHGIPDLDATSRRTKISLEQPLVCYVFSMGLNLTASEQGTTLSCDSSPGLPGCSIIEWSEASYGEYFDSQGGGVFAMKWDDDGISVCEYSCHWAHCAIIDSHWLRRELLSCGYTCGYHRWEFADAIDMGHAGSTARSKWLQ